MMRHNPKEGQIESFLLVLPTRTRRLSRERFEMTEIRSKLIAFCAALLVVSFTTDAMAHCSLPHRHYRGRVYYLTASQYYPPVWCDDCGKLWSYGDAAVERSYDVYRVNPLPSQKVETITTKKVQKTTTIEK
jgi:hypothetical protein